MTIRDSNWVSAYTVGEHVIDVNNYDILGYIYCDGGVNYHFTFPSGSSEGMSPNWSMVEVPLSGVNEWRVQVTGSDPGVDSPEYSSGLVAKNVVIEFSAKVVNGGNPISEGRIYIKDENGSWNNYVPLSLINAEQDNYNNGQFALNEYNVYRANLNDLTRPEAEMRQFSIQLTNGLSTSETWTFDWIKVKVSGWDFKDNQIGWEIRQNGQTTDFYADEFWRISPTGKQPQILSPDNLMIDSFYTKVGLRYSINNTTSEVARAYFDTGGGFSTSCMASQSVSHDGTQVSAIFDIPSCARGTTKRILFDLFDNDNYANKMIAINNIAFTVDEDDYVTYQVPTISQVLSDSYAAVYPPENLSASAITQNSATINWTLGLNDTSSDISYKLYRKNSAGYVSMFTTSDLSYTDTDLQSDSNYQYYATTVIDDVESSPSATLDIKTAAESSDPVLDISIIDTAITQVMDGDLPMSDESTFIFGKVPNSVFVWAEVRLVGADPSDISWQFRNAIDGYVYYFPTTVVSLGDGRYYIYAEAASTSTGCDGAFGVWKAILRGPSYERLLTLNFTMSIRKPYIAFVDEGASTAESVTAIWSNVQCANYYPVYRDGKLLVEISTEEEPDDRYIDTDVVPGETYTYQVFSLYRDENMEVRSEPTTADPFTVPYPAIVISPVQGFQLLQ